MAMAAMMRSGDRIPEAYVSEDDCNNSCQNLCDERQDMWSLIKPELRANTFSSLLSGGPGNAAAMPWDLTTSKSYGGSGGLLRHDSLQLCTEGLGCESSDCLTDCSTDCSCSSSEIADDYLSEDEEDQENMDTVEEESDVAPAHAFPPPLASISACNPSYMRSFKKDGRFVLRSVKAPLQSNNFLHSYREGGRLKMQLISRNDDDFPLLQALNPEAEIDQEEQEEATEEEHQDLEAGTESCCWSVSEEDSIPEKFSDTFLAGLEPVTSESFPGMIHFSDVVLNSGIATGGFKAACNSLPEKTSNFKLNEFQEAKKISDTKPAGKQRLGPSCVNAYIGWRTALVGKPNFWFPPFLLLWVLGGRWVTRGAVPLHSVEASGALGFRDARLATAVCPSPKWGLSGCFFIRGLLAGCFRRFGRSTVSAALSTDMDLLLPPIRVSVLTDLYLSVEGLLQSELWMVIASSSCVAMVDMSGFLLTLL